MRNIFPHKLFLLVGPSGSGKSVILEGVMRKIPELRRIPSFTTRPKRPSEKEGREHFFVTVVKFRQLIQDKKLLEYEEVYPGMFYGMPLKETAERLQRNNLIRDIDVFGAQSLKKLFPENTVSLFVKPPNLKALENRIKRRGNMTEKEISGRLKRASLEMQKARLADYQVINDKLKTCIKEVAQIIRNEMVKTKRLP